MGEKKFIEKCNDVASLDKDKEIKFFHCIGDSEIDFKFVQAIENERSNYHVN